MLEDTWLLKAEYKTFLAAQGLCGVMAASSLDGDCGRGVILLLEPHNQLQDGGRPVAAVG